jgi:glutamate dehydrogenase/leucine dehydrogenase
MLKGATRAVVTGAANEAATAAVRATATGAGVVAAATSSSRAPMPGNPVLLVRRP